MKPHLQYLWYVLRHKYYVFVAGVKIGVPIKQLIAHDLSKFSRAEWGPYVDRFYGSGQATEEFHRAVHAHYDCNPHHWQAWQYEDEGYPCPMPEDYALEMVADWMGAGKAITGEWEVKDWFDSNKDKIELHRETRDLVERIIYE